MVDGHARFFDWGDAVVSHPFASALVLRSVVRWILGVHDETAQERRILDAYLEPFTALAPRDELRDVVDVACEVGKVARALVWARAVALLPPDDPDPDDFRPAPLEWMLELLDGPLASPRPRLPVMAEQETKSVIVTQAVHDYAVAHGTPPGRGAGVADRARRRSSAASAGCRSRPSRARS